MNGSMQYTTLRRWASLGAFPALLATLQLAFPAAAPQPLIRGASRAQLSLL